MYTRLKDNNLNLRAKEQLELMEIQKEKKSQGLDSLSQGLGYHSQGAWLSIPACQGLVISRLVITPREKKVRY
jgi:hypothetical protein